MSKFIIFVEIRLLHGVRMSQVIQKILWGKFWWFWETFQTLLNFCHTWGSVCGLFHTWKSQNVQQQIKLISKFTTFSKSNPYIVLTCHRRYKNWFSESLDHFWKKIVSLCQALCSLEWHIFMEKSKILLVGQKIVLGEIIIFQSMYYKKICQTGSTMHQHSYKEKVGIFQLT